MLNLAKKINVFILIPNFNSEKKSTMNVRTRQPLSEAIIASILRTEGYAIKLVDANVLNSSDEEILRVISDFQPDVLIVTTTPIDRWECPNSHIDNIFGLIDVANANNKVVIGSHGTTLPQWVFDNCKTDFIIRGEPELAVAKLIGFLAGDENIKLSEISGLSYRLDGKILNNSSQRIVDLDCLPLPAYDLLPMERYASNDFEQPFSIVLTSRGCPFSCIFCLKAMASGVYIVRSIPKVIEEIEYLIKTFNIKSIYFQDWEFFIDSRRVEEICRAILDMGLKFSWGANARATDIIRNKELMPLIKKAGCVSINMGLESASDKVLVKINKQISKAEMQQAIEILQKNEIIGGLYMLLNAPGEDCRTIRETQDFIEKNKLRVRPFLAPVPYPGTELFNELKKKFPLRQIDWDNAEDYAGTLQVAMNPKAALLYLRGYKYLRKFLRFCKDITHKLNFQSNRLILLVFADTLGFISLFRPTTSKKAIVLFFNGKLGDIVCLTPVLRLIKEHYADHELIIYARKGFMAILDNNPYIDQRVGFAGEEESSSFSWILRQWRMLGRYKIAVYMNLVNNYEGGILGVALNAKKRCLVTTKLDGMALRMLYPYFDTYDYKFDKQIKEFYFDILAELGVTITEKKNELFFSGQAAEAEEFFKTHDLHSRTVIGIAISSGKDYFKIWPAEYWVKLIKLLVIKYEAKVLIFGQSADKQIIDSVIEKVGVNGIVVLDKSLNVLPYYLKKCNLFISVDMGVLYIADAVGVPVIDIIGVCDENTQRPENNYRLVTNREICPAYSKMLASPDANSDEMRHCYESITPNQVFEVCQNILNLNKSV